MKARRLAVVLALAYVFVSAAEAQFRLDGWPERVKNGISNLRRAGLLVGLPDGLGYPHTVSRYELAVMTQATTAHLERILDQFEQRLLHFDSDPRSRKFLTSSANSIRGWKDDLVFLRAMAKDFGPDLKEIGLDEEALIRSLRKCEKLSTELPRRLDRFRDVPKRHWADKAVHELKRAGLLRGYPNRTLGSA
jgi:hypothetical protein